MKMFYFLLVLAVIALAGLCFLGTTATAADSSPPVTWLAVSTPNAIAQGGCGSCLFISTNQNNKTTVTSRAAPAQAIPEEKQNLYFALTKDHTDKGA